MRCCDLRLECSVCCSPRLLTGLTQRRVLREALHTHGLARYHVHNGSISRLEEFGVVLQLLARAAVNLLLELCKLAGDVSSVTVQHRSITSTDLARMIEDDHLRSHIEGKDYFPPVKEVNKKSVFCCDISFLHISSFGMCSLIDKIQRCLFF